MIHYLCVFHSKYFHSLVDYFLTISSAFVVYFYEIFVVCLVPFTLSSVYLRYFGGDFVNLFFKKGNSVDCCFPVTIIAVFHIFFFELVFLLDKVALIFLLNTVANRLDIKSQKLILLIQEIKNLNIFFFNFLNTFTNLIDKLSHLYL